MMSRKLVATPAAGLIAFLIAMIAVSGREHLLDVGHPECPHSWTTFAPPPTFHLVATVNPVVSNSALMPIPTAPKTTLSFPSGFSVPRATTNVPEFHDCQRVLLADGSLGPLMAVFSSYRLDSLTDSLNYAPKNAADSTRSASPPHRPRPSPPTANDRSRPAPA